MHGSVSKAKSDRCCNRICSKGRNEAFDTVHVAQCLQIFSGSLNLVPCQKKFFENTEVTKSPVSSSSRGVFHVPRPLKHPAYRSVWGVGVSGSLVRFLDYTIVAWLLVQQTENVFAVSLLIFFRMIPFIFLGPVLGTLIDRYSRISILRLTQLGMALSAAGFGIAVATDSASPPVIYFYTSVMGSLFMSETQSKRAYVSDVVGRTFLGSALALDMVAIHMGWFIGSNLGGAFVSLMDPAFAYFIISGLLILNYWFLRTLPSMFLSDQNSERNSTVANIKDGFRFANKNRIVWAGLLVVGITNFFGYAFESMAPAFARDIYHTGPFGFGLVLAAQGLGTFMTAAYITFRRKRLSNPGSLLIISALLHMAGSIAFSFSQTTALGVVSITVLGLISGIFAITHTVLFLLVSPPDLRGRILGLQSGFIGLYPLGTLLLGITADNIGLAQAVRLFAVAGLALLVIIWFRYPELRRSTR